MSRHSECKETAVGQAEDMELGMCYELMSNEVYMPCHRSRGWVRCYFCAYGNSFSIFLEGSDRFLLKAILVEKTFYISLYEHFDIINEKVRGHYVAKLMKMPDSSFLLCSNQCRYCDDYLGQYTCSWGSSQREILAKITHMNRRHKVANVDMRCSLITVPTVEAGSRLVWWAHGINAPDISGYINSRSLSKPVGMRLLNRLPQWDDSLECLVLKFQGNRILCPSARNILLFEEQDIKNSLQKSASDELNADQAILQFGKSSEDEYVLDFQYPLSPIQAFAIALTTYVYPDKGSGPDDSQHFKP